MLRISLILISLFLLYFILSLPYYSGDVKNHAAWAVSFLNNPLGFYDREIPGFYTPNYPPVTIYLFALGENLYQITRQWIWYLNITLPVFPSSLVLLWEWENIRYAFLKLPAILGNVLLAYGIYLLIPFIKKEVSKKQRILAAGLFLFNPASLYLSALWGQVDLLPIAFLILSLFLLYKSKIYPSAIFMVLSFLSKQTVVIFLPIYMYLMWKQFGWQTAVRAFFLMVGSFYLAFLPFHQFSFFWAPQFYLSTFSSVALTIGENAFNLWGLLFDFKKGISDQQLFLFLNYYQWGILLMIIFLMTPVYLFLKNNLSAKKLLALFFVISLIYFFFLTRLHERHLAPAVAFGTLLAMVDRKYWSSLIFVSIIFLLNLYNGSFQPNIEIFNWAVSSLIFLKLLVVGYFLLILYNLYLFLWEK